MNEKNAELAQVREEIRMRLDIVTVVERYVALKRAGTSYKGLCPFHKEKSPSFHVNPDSNFFHCFGCGKGGDVFTFLMEIEGVSFMEALTQAGREVGIAVESSTHRVQSTGGSTLSRELAYAANGHAMNYFYDQMKKSPDAIDYFRSRGLSGETVRDFRLGFAPDSWDGLTKYLETQRISPLVAAEAGLAVSSNSGSRPYDRFRKRVIYPILDMAGRPVAFGGRTMDPEGQPKYLNSPETVLYRKNRVFYGMHQARTDIREKGSVIIVEGYMDMLMLYQAGVKNVVATCGTAMTVEHGHILRRITPLVYLVFDGDNAGYQAAERAVLNLFPLEIDLRVVILPAGEDPDSIIQKYGTDRFNELLSGALPGLEFYINRLSADGESETPQGNSRIVTALAKLLGGVQNQVLVSHYSRELAARFGVEEALFRRMVGQETDVSRAGFETDHGQRERNLEELLASEEGSLMHLLLAAPEQLYHWKEKISMDLFSNSLFRNLYSLVVTKDGDYTSIIDEIEDPVLRDLVSLMFIRKSRDSVDAISHKVVKLEKSIIDRKIDLITRQLSMVTRAEDKMRLLAEQTNLLKAQKGRRSNT